MTFKLAVAVILATFLLLPLAGCASGNVLEEFPQTIREGAKLYRETRPAVVEARKLVVENWDEIPAEVRPSMKTLDAILPQLDEFGKKLVIAEEWLDGINRNGYVKSLLANVDWDKAMATVLATAGKVAAMKAQGQL